MVPNTSADFDRAHRAPLTPWGDVRIPPELIALISTAAPKTSLELGCGLGRYTRYLAGRGVSATGVDFSAVAIEKARERAHDVPNARYTVGDVTKLDGIEGPFDVALDVGCFHCLGPDAQQGYVDQLARVLAPSATLLIWALDESPADEHLSPQPMRRIFGPRFELADARASRRRIVRSHWYWLSRRR